MGESNPVRNLSQTISNFKSIKGNQGAYQKEFRAYDREQESCKNKLCSGIIIKINIQIFFLK